MKPKISTAVELAVMATVALSPHPLHSNVLRQVCGHVDGKRRQAVVLASQKLAQGGLVVYDTRKLAARVSLSPLVNRESVLNALRILAPHGYLATIYQKLKLYQPDNDASN